MDSLVGLIQNLQTETNRILSVAHADGAREGSHRSYNASPPSVTASEGTRYRIELEYKPARFGCSALSEFPIGPLLRQCEPPHQDALRNTARPRPNTRRNK